MLTDLFNLDIPENADNFMLMILGLCSLEFIDTSVYLEKIFTLRDTEAFRTTHFSDGTSVAKYAEAGYESIIFLELLGPLFFMIIAMVLFMLLKKALQKCAMRYGDNFLTKRLKKETDYLVFIVRFLLEGCIDIGLSALIAVVSINDKSFSNPSEAFSSVLAFLFILLLVLAPFVYRWLTVQHRKTFIRTGLASDSKYFALFENYREDHMSLRYGVYFFLRRYIIIILLIVMPNFSQTQILG